MRILLVEDHPQLAESVVQALKGAGWTVDLLQDGVAADLALASEEYALAILDVGLPRMDGFEVLARLRGRSPTGSTRRTAPCAPTSPTWHWIPSPTTAPGGSSTRSTTSTDG